MSSEINQFRNPNDLLAGSPIIIVGAGPVGLSLGLSLAHHGIQSIILEKNPGLEQFSRAILIPPRTLDILEGWGLLKTFIKTGIYSPCLRAYAAESDRVAITIDFTTLRSFTENAGFLFLPQDRTEALLLDAVRATGKCQVQFGTTVSGFSQDDHSVTVKAAGPHGTFEMHGQYLVGCDGAHSVVRQQLGLELLGKTYKTRVLIADVRFPEGFALPTPRIALKASGPLVLLRFEDSRSRIVAAVSPSELEEQARSKDGVAARVAMLAGKTPFELLWSSTFNIHHRTVKRFRVGRVFLAGDAAHLSSPAGGMGMNSGIEDANNLAWKLAAVLCGGNSSLLDSYESERLYAVVHAVERTSDLASNTLYFAPYWIRVLSTSMFRIAMKIRRVRQVILQAMSMLGTRYPRSQFITGDRKWAGRIAPDCEVKAGKSSSRLLKGRRGRHIMICRGVKPSRNCDLELIEISTAEDLDFQRDWNVSTPFCALIRPDGFIAWAKANPSSSDIEDAVNRIRILHGRG